jgi:hypothetical protein
MPRRCQPRWRGSRSRQAAWRIIRPKLLEANKRDAFISSLFLFTRSKSEFPAVLLKKYMHGADD